MHHQFFGVMVVVAPEGEQSLYSIMQLSLRLASVLLTETKVAHSEMRVVKRVFAVLGDTVLYCGC
jgi:hypothetical protein